MAFRTRAHATKLSNDALLFLLQPLVARMAPVRVTDISYVAAPAGAADALPPEPIKLNAMEAQWVVFPPLQHLLIFGGEGHDQLPPFDAVLRSLKSSLAATLATGHAPLAGRLHYLADTGDVAILCSTDDEGVKFVAAECDADVRRLAGDDEQDVDTFERLVPELDMSELPHPVLAVQATRLGGGGVALGLTLHHGVADGRSLWAFVGAWTAACRGDAAPAPPVFDRARVRMPSGEELARQVLRKYAPNLPLASLPDSIEELREDRKRFIRRTFTVDAQQVQRLKARISQQLGQEAQEGAPPLRRPPSTFVAVTALAWTCFVRCRPFPADDDVFLCFIADVRDRLDPPAGADYFGTCIAMCLPRLTARALHDERALATAAAALQGAVQGVVEDPLGGWPGWEFLRIFGEVPMDRWVNVSGSPSFRVYEIADFGWGRPTRTENVGMNRDGQVALVRARDGEGVQVSVSMLQREHMDAFKEEFLDLLRASRINPFAPCAHCRAIKWQH